MDTEGDDLRQYEPVPDVLILAAVERAMRHGTDAVWIPKVIEHLGFRYSRYNSRRVRRDLEHLAAPQNKCVARSERHGRDYWTLTETGKTFLKSQRDQGKVGELPESPQHREWRQSRYAAAAQMDEFRALLDAAVEAAEDARLAPTSPPSADWFELGQRLGAAFWLVGSATYSRDEWPEPDDARLDSDPDPGPPGRRAVGAWHDKKALAKGDQP
ncbi:MAG TPA: hypothetical protein VG898_10220 [Solirubrobacterales bacterium]|nr:hypothetical protein [Solirubrobacterales bacterium]